MHICCSTKFDITATGVKSNFNKNRIPFNDQAGNFIVDLSSWQYSRNQQRNWETLNQILLLRTLPTDITTPVKIVRDNINFWIFEFVIEQPSAVELDNDPIGAIIHDCMNVPMITGLTENDNNIVPMLLPDSNIFFSVITDK